MVFPEWSKDGFGARNDMFIVVLLRSSALGHDSFRLVMPQCPKLGLPLLCRILCMNPSRWWGFHNDAVVPFLQHWGSLIAAMAAVEWVCFFEFDEMDRVG